MPSFWFDLIRWQGLAVKYTFGLKLPLNLGHLGSRVLLHPTSLKLSDTSEIQVARLLVALNPLLFQLHCFMQVKKVWSIVLWLFWKHYVLVSLNIHLRCIGEQCMQLLWRPLQSTAWSEPCPLLAWAAVGPGIMHPDSHWGAQQLPRGAPTVHLCACAWAGAIRNVAAGLGLNLRKWSWIRVIFTYRTGWCR